LISVVDYSAKYKARIGEFFYQKNIYNWPEDQDDFGVRISIGSILFDFSNGCLLSSARVYAFSPINTTLGTEQNSLFAM